jgi:predicted SprT family Zn-dependent metalloprotease
MNSKKKIGTSQATRDNTTGEVNIKALSISKNFEMTEDQLKGIIVHEMAHLYIMQEIDFREKHGPRFKALIQNLERKVDFDVPETESTILQQLQSSMKPVPIIIGQTNRGKYLAIAIADKT